MKKITKFHCGVSIGQTMDIDDKMVYFVCYITHLLPVNKETAVHLVMFIIFQIP